jgi:hypothetical protein
MSARVQSVSARVPAGARVANRVRVANGVWVANGTGCEGVGSERGPGAGNEREGTSSERGLGARETSARARILSAGAKERRHTISRVGATIANYKGSQDRKLEVFIGTRTFWQSHRASRRARGEREPLWSRTEARHERLEYCLVNEVKFKFLPNII